MGRVREYAFIWMGKGFIIRIVSATPWIPDFFSTNDLRALRVAALLHLQSVIG